MFPWERGARRNLLHALAEPLRAAVVVVEKKKKSDLSDLNGFGGFEISVLGCFDCLLV